MDKKFILREAVIPEIYRQDLKINDAQLQRMIAASDKDMESISDFIGLPWSAYYYESNISGCPARRRRMELTEALKLFKLKSKLEEFIGHKVYPPTLSESDSIRVEYASEFFCKSKIYVA